MSEPKKHNPSNLSDEQIGTAEGWRHFDIDEYSSFNPLLPRGTVEMWNDKVGAWVSGSFYCVSQTAPVRTKLSRAELRKARGLPEEPAKAPEVSARVHDLKTDAAVFDSVGVGIKSFEIRRDDRGYAVGDTLRLRKTRYTGEEMKAGAPLIYEGEPLDVPVTYILRGPVYGLQEGWCIMAITEATAAKDAEIARLKLRVSNYDSDRRYMRDERNTLAAELERAKEAWSTYLAWYESYLAECDDKAQACDGVNAPEWNYRKGQRSGAINGNIALSNLHKLLAPQPERTSEVTCAPKTTSMTASVTGVPAQRIGGQSDPAPLAESLLPCPFRGSDAKLHGGPEWFVRCQKLGVCYGSGVFGFSHKHDAIRLWNRRALESQLAAVTAERDEFANAALATGVRAETAERKLAEAIEGFERIQSRALESTMQSVSMDAIERISIAAIAKLKGAA